MFLFPFKNYFLRTEMKKLSIFLLFIIAAGCSKTKVENPSSEFLKAEKLAELKNEKLGEISGIAASIANPGLFWAHNDSGNGAEIFLINKKLEIVMSCKLDKIQNRDWEDVAVGPGPEEGKNYIYVGEIGDNESKYPLKHIYRFLEPVFNDSSKSLNISAFDTITFKLEDKKKDTETLLLDPGSKDLYVVSKREEPVWVYKIKYPYSVTDTLIAKKLISLPMKQIVGGDISSDGEKLLLKNYEHVYYWTIPKGKSIEESLKEKPFEVPYELEPQGESIAWELDNSGFLTLSEKNIGKSSFLYFYGAASKK